MEAVNEVWCFINGWKNKENCYIQCSGHLTQPYLKKFLKAWNLVPPGVVGVVGEEEFALRDVSEPVDNFKSLVKKITFFWIYYIQGDFL